MVHPKPSPFVIAPLKFKLILQDNIKKFYGLKKSRTYYNWLVQKSNKADFARIVLT